MIGATHHLTHNKHQFINFEYFSPKKNKVYFSDTTTLNICRKNKVKICIVNRNTIYLTNILYIFDLQKNIFLINDCD